MSSPVTPGQLKEIIPAVNGNFCQKFIASLSLPRLIHSWFSYMYSEDGAFTDDFIADICAIGCVGSGTGGGDGGGTGIQAPLIFATDGDLTDRVRITWDAISGATSYDIYRSATNSSASAVVIKSGELSTFYEDEDVVEGVYYYYWVKTRTLSGISGFSNGDRGHAGTVLTSLAQIVDLNASKGFSYGGVGTIRLMWTPVNGAQTYDIYRSTENDFSSADLIDSNRTPFDNAASLSNGTAPYMVDNSYEIYYQHSVGNGVEQFQTYYFWVLARRSDPSAVSLPSNAGTGWATGPGSGVAPLAWGKLESTFSETIPDGVTAVWFALFGAGGGGAGGNANYGGGGGGGGSTIVGRYPVVAGSKFRVRHSPEADTSNAAFSSAGADGPEMFLEYSANGLFSDTVTVASAGVAGGGEFNAGGGGVGGPGATATNVGLTNSFDWTGRDGEDASGTKGGRAGYRFGSTRGPGAHFNNFTAFSTFTGDGGSRGAGSGSYASPNDQALATGGKGERGYVAWATLLQ